jgi:hypothetical protein
MIRPWLAALLALACSTLAPAPATGAGAGTTTVQKLCTSASGTVAVPYATSCPVGSTVTAKLCPSGVQVPYASPCPASLPASPSTPTVAGVRKLCPDGSIVAYSSSCATAGTVRKLCPSGAIVGYSSTCPATAPVLAVGGRARALQACPSVMNLADTLAPGATYKVEGFAGWSALGGASPGAGVRDLIVLSLPGDARHQGDGWFAYWVPAGCVAAA